MPRTLLTNARLLDPEAPAAAPGALLLEEGRIAARFTAGQALPADAERIDVGGAGLAPGFLDVHHHGRLVFDAPHDAALGLDADSRQLLRHGVTGFLPTTVAWPRDALRERVSAWAAAAATGAAGGASPLGLHLEGPWIRAEAAGAQPSDGIRDAGADEVRDVLERCEGQLRMVTLAPELPGAGALLDALARRGVIASLGHSLASAEQVDAAVARGARHVTHLFNAMGALHHRTPGLVGSALAEPRLSCDLICDGVHVHPAVVRLAARAKGEQLMLISDRVTLPDGGRGYGAGEVHEDGVALRLADGRLAGSSLMLDRAQRNAVAFGALDELAALAAVTLRPARLLGIEAERGTLRVGARADLVVLDAAGDLRETWLAGRPVYRAAAD